MGKMVDSDGYNIVKCTYIESQMARMTNAMFFKGGLTRKHCFLAMFPEGGQTRKHCFLAIFPKGGQTRKHCFLAMFHKGGQTRKHLIEIKSRSALPSLRWANKVILKYFWQRAFFYIAYLPQK